MQANNPITMRFEKHMLDVIPKKYIYNPIVDNDVYYAKNIM